MSFDLNINTNEVIISSSQNHIIVEDRNKEVVLNIEQPITQVIEVVSMGPKGDMGDSIFNPNEGGSYSTTSSLEVTGSLIVTQGITGSLQGTSSFALSASWAPTPNNTTDLVYYYNKNESDSRYITIKANSSTGTLISFTADRVYGTLTTPETGNITADITNAKLGVTNIIIHNSATTPTFGSQFKKLSGSGNYIVGAVNYIYCTFISVDEIIYSINQRS